MKPPRRRPNWPIKIEERQEPRPPDRQRQRCPPDGLFNKLKEKRLSLNYIKKIFVVIYKQIQNIFEIDLIVASSSQ